MKFLYKAILLAVMIGVSAPAIAQSRDLTTTYASNNNFAGNTFNLNPAVNLTVSSFDVHLGNPGAAVTIAIYWRAGTAQGFESNPAGWTLLGTANVVSRGPGVGTPVPVGGLRLTAGHTYGIYVDVQNYPSASMLYTDGANTFSTADLSLTTLVGKGNPAFTGSTFTPRQWNGTIHYTTFTTCAAEGFSGTKLTMCRQVCEMHYPTTTLNALIKTWAALYHQDPPCAR